jgi:hypothetical protein
LKLVKDKSFSSSLAGKKEDKQTVFAISLRLVLQTTNQREKRFSLLPLEGGGLRWG